MKRTLLLLSLALILTVTRASAYEPPQVTPVSWILATQHNDNVDEKKVILVGHVIRPDNGSDWWFSDATGSVRLETGDRELPVGTLLRIRGRIDQATWGIGIIEVKVKRWEYANKPQSSGAGS